MLLASRYPVLYYFCLMIRKKSSPKYFCESYERLEVYVQVCLFLVRTESAGRVCVKDRDYLFLNLPYT